MPFPFYLYKKKTNSLSSPSERVHISFLNKGSPRSVVDNMVDYSLELSKIDFHSHIYIPFWSNTLGKIMNPIILSALS